MIDPLTTTILSAVGMEALKAGVRKAIEKIFREKKEKPLTAEEKQLAAKAADAAVAELIQPATLADVEKFDGKYGAIKRRVGDGWDKKPKAGKASSYRYVKKGSSGRFTTKRQPIGKMSKKIGAPSRSVRKK
jgi:hypothetical protein